MFREYRKDTLHFLHSVNKKIRLAIIFFGYFQYNNHYSEHGFFHIINCFLPDAQQVPRI
jgi:hypothetical protein